MTLIARLRCVSQGFGLWDRKLGWLRHDEGLGQDKRPSPLRRFVVVGPWVIECHRGVGSAAARHFANHFRALFGSLAHLRQGLSR